MYTLWHGDCLEEMSRIEAGSVDMILTDLPYGTTACAFDVRIPFEPLWREYKRVIKKNGAIVLFGVQPFTSLLVMSNLEWFKYSWVWVKTKPNGWQHAKNKPMQTTEDITVFSQSPMGHQSLLGDNRMTYNPQGVKPLKEKVVSPVWHGQMMGARPKQVGKKYLAFTGFPSNVLNYPNITGNSVLHPSQKPTSLLEYLVKTYTREGDTVLDSTCGSGSTLEAAMRCNRRSIGIEKDAHYFDVAQQRLERVAAELRGELTHLPMFAEAL